MGGSRGLSYFQQDIPLAPTCLRSNSDWRVLRLALVERKVLARYNPGIGPYGKHRLVWPDLSVLH
jgi:hypothetical protein